MYDPKSPQYTVTSDYYGTSADGVNNFCRQWDVKNAVRLLAYMRMAYPQAKTSLLGPDGFIVSSKELEGLAHHLIND